MGCNFYLRKNECTCCNRYDEIHIGKSSHGWTFSFKGYDKNHYEDNGFDKPIKSWKDWKEVLNKEDNIYDEYGQKISLEELEALIEDRKDQPNNHTKYCKSREHDCISYVWLDDEGNSFRGTEFR